VISGDTLVLVGKSGSATAGPPKEITITLASLVAPSISRGPRQTTEEPFAWESREFLRKLCIGRWQGNFVKYTTTQALFYD
jgi:staphylococcal nuclease domain-containing protein 1